MKTMLSVLTLLAMAMTPALGEDIKLSERFAQENGCYEGPCKKYVDPPVVAPTKSVCETPTGYGLVAFAEQGVFDQIKAALAAGEYVGINVENTDITEVLSEGGYRVIDAKVGPTGKLFICYQTY